MKQNEKDRLQYMIDVMQAYKEGKEIESIYLSNTALTWFDNNNPQFNWRDFDYRVKPEPPKPQYRPFESAAEIMEAIKEHGSYIVPGLNRNNRLLIIEFNNTNIWCGVSQITRNLSYYFEHNYTFADGTPFGKLIEG